MVFIWMDIFEAALRGRILLVRCLHGLQLLSVDWMITASWNRCGLRKAILSKTDDEDVKGEKGLVLQTGSFNPEALIPHKRSFAGFFFFFLFT